MQYAYFSDTEQSSYKVALLIPNIRKTEIETAYLAPHDLMLKDLIAINLHQAIGKKKTPAAEQKAYITEELAPVFNDLGVEYILCADAEYFKTLTKQSKVEANLGYVMDCAFGPWKVVYIPNHSAIFYDPEKVRDKIRLAMTGLTTHMEGRYVPPGNEVIKFAAYPETDEEIEDWLVKLLDHKMLTADIEGFSLKHYDCGIGTIALAWSKHEGIAFTVDYLVDTSVPNLFGRQVKHEYRHKMLRRFFELCHEKGISIGWHNIGFDVYVLIYQLFMEHILDYEGMLYGLKILMGDEGKWHCTKLITYLATNSCAGNKLGLKDQAQEFAGNYAVDEIKDIRKIPLAQLLQYNLVDALSTWYVFEKHMPTVIVDMQMPVYQTLFQPAMVDIIQMQLTGMPVNMKRVLEVEIELKAEEDRTIAEMYTTQVVQKYNYHRLEKHTNKMNSEWKSKRMTIQEMAAQAEHHEPTRKETTFNPNSSPQLQELLFEIIGLPVLGYTDSNQPSTDGDTIKALQNHTTDVDVLKFLKGLEDYAAVNKIITDFIPSLKNAQQGIDGWHYLFGNFNLGGTKSGRLSSSKPNLQNLPANSRYAKAIKSCFEAPPGWLFVGLDFASLEDRISALTTKDPNKLKVYTDGYDGHSLRAYGYWGDQMPDIDGNCVASVNSIAKHPVYKTFRQEGKVPTFLLTYAGTYKGIMEQCGFSFEKAKLIEEKYHALYKVSDDWVAAKLEQATKDGYVTVAFGLRLRTPLLHQVILGNRKTPYEATAEGRTAGNALGQSYCLLNTRAGIEFNLKVRSSNYRLDIKPCAHIHDAQYFIIRDDVAVVSYVNEHLVKAVEWQDDPEIWHDEVKLGGELSIFYPTWKDEIVIPNGANENDIPDVIQKALEEREAKKKAA